MNPSRLASSFESLEVLGQAHDIGFGGFLDAEALASLQAAVDA